MKAQVNIPAAKPIRSADRVFAGRLYISDWGDAIAPDGYCEQLTIAISGVVFKRFDAKDQKKALRVLRVLTSHERVPGERWDAFLHDNDEQAEHRILGVLRSLKCKADKVPLDGTLEVTHVSATYIKMVLVTLRQFYRKLCRMRLRVPDSPMDLKNWRTMDLKTRMYWAKLRNYHPVFGMEHAGHRFFTKLTPSKARMLYSPYEAAAALSRAIDATDAPAIIVELKEMQRVNGLRFADFAFGTAYGYALAGLGDHFKCRNKQGGVALTKTATMGAAIQSSLRARFESAPHPYDPARTLWDRVVELAPKLALGGAVKQAAIDELNRYKLFGKSPTEDAFTYDAYRYWLRKAAFAHGVVVQTNLGPWTPTSIVFRKAAIALDVKTLFERTSDEDERKVALLAISDKFHHSTDQTKAYADWEYELDAIRKRLSVADASESQQAAARASSPAPIRSLRLAASTERWRERLKQRPMEKTQ